MDHGSNGHIMFSTVREASRTDARLRLLLEAAREYAEIYLIAEQRKKGCDGMGELAMVREEFRDSLDDLLNYVMEEGYLHGDIRHNIAVAARELGAIRP
jgi:hypothetical protein